MLEFGALPPEINSARMYAGPGSGPMLAAAVGWDELAAELYSVAASTQAVIADLVGGSWMGPSAMLMAAAATRNVAWLGMAAAQAEQTAMQAKAAAGAFEVAFAMTVPPPVIAANRALSHALKATNFFGQNTLAIMATEMHYVEMWIQDATAMYGYAGAAAAASRLTPFAEPPNTTHAAGLAGQAAAVAKAVGTTAASDAEVMLSQVTAALPQALDGLAGPALYIVNSIGPALQLLVSPIPAFSSTLGLFSSTLSASMASMKAMAPLAQAAGSAAALASGVAGRVGEAVGMGGSKVAAELGHAASLGRLSVPTSWASAAAHSISPLAPAALPAAAVHAPVSALSNAAAPMLGGLPMAASTAARGGAALQATRRVSVIPRMPAAG